MDQKVRAAWILVFTLCLSTLFVSWLELSGSTEFTSGRPERTELIMEIEVDANQETQEIRIEKATPFIMWLMTRDSIEEDFPEENGTAGGDATTLDTVRGLTTLTVCLAGAVAGFSAGRGSVRMRWLLSLWMAGLLLFVIGVPIAWMLDMAETLDDGLPDDYGPGESFAHVNSETGSELVFIGIAFYFDGDGWDLGMIDSGNRSAAMEEPPEDPNGTHIAHIGWDGEISLRYGNALTIWLIVGILLSSIYFYEKRQRPSNIISEDE
ncbi:MAG: hypothetical protein VX627_02740 [Candidatus Thermoplasmatota archaeon]|nr:hypothetical protein [Candidatus Thermoplasmatota archaeon]